jgi:hypothetical protein
VSTTPFLLVVLRVVVQLSEMLSVDTLHYLSLQLNELANLLSVESSPSQHDELQRCIVLLKSFRRHIKGSFSPPKLLGVRMTYDRLRQLFSTLFGFIVAALLRNALSFGK